MNNRAPSEDMLDNFPNLPDKNCVSIIQNNLLEALGSETILEWQIAEKMMALPDPSRETLTKTFNDAIKKNQQKIAGINIADWLKKYLEKYNGIERNPNTFFEFCTKTPEIQKLPKQDQIRLMRLFRMYDYLLVEPIQDFEYPVENIFRFPMRLDSTPDEISAQVQTAQVGFKPAPKRTITEKLPLRDLLRKYPAAGEQVITSGQLKLSHFDRPVQPSIRNWIYDYTSQLGQEHHDSMQRMKYMFSSANGKNLTSLEREKLGIILKSFDENIPLPVDASRNEIVFVVSDQRLVDNEQHNKQETISERPVFQKAPQMAPLSSKPAHESFTKPYPRQETKPPVPPRSVQRKIPDTRYQIPDTKNEMQFTNPYPKPGTHEPQLAARAENISNVRFDEGLPPPASLREQARLRSVAGGPAAIKSQPQSIAPENVPPQTTFSRPKNVFYPHYGPEREVKPEPRIEGNIVDLSEK